MIAKEFLLFKGTPQQQRGVNYYFDQEGDCIPVHSHKFSHASFAVIGDFDVTDGVKTVLLKQGQRIVFLPGQLHGLAPKTIGNQLMNLSEAGCDGR